MLLKNSDRDFLLLGSNSIIILTKFRLLLVRLIVHHYWVGMSVRSQPLLFKGQQPPLKDKMIAYLGHGRRFSDSHKLRVICDNIQPF